DQADGQKIAGRGGVAVELGPGESDGVKDVCVKVTWQGLLDEVARAPGREDLGDTALEALRGLLARRPRGRRVLPAAAALAPGGRRGPRAVGGPGWSRSPSPRRGPPRPRR
ncbi:unnamed protein product, partial [Prorocentrum cordatum]